MNAWIYEAIPEHSPQPAANGHAETIMDFSEYLLTLTPEMDDHIPVLRKKPLKYTSTKQYGYYVVIALSKNFLTSHGRPIKSVCDVTM